ncbi:hypothetical protein GFY24_03590 [Nocardia sp. SYP-A9097]|uniref:hypothetical protein n=1 Tax=Nocardia sp. SYP-A9097 TaxID=2663237 RepID=UPI00129A6721|nr:hypothetical protein [Nocardia sp. SYP-A9097]MRH86563.1 hypothetical protein [Nocardia sp. SYP-A9097]
MRKSAIAVALLALPLLAACSTEDKTGAPANLVSVTSTPAAVTSTTAPALTTTTAPTSAAISTTSAVSTTGTLTAPLISKSLQDKGGLDTKTADCIAGIYVDEGLSQSGIQKLIDHGYNNPAGIGLTTDDLRKAGKATKRIVSECIR